MQSPPIKLRFEDGIFVPLTPVSGLQEGEILEFRIPEPELVYLCETDRLAAVDQGLVVRIDPDSAPYSDIDA